MIVLPVQSCIRQNGETGSTQIYPSAIAIWYSVVDEVDSSSDTQQCVVFSTNCTTNIVCRVVDEVASS